MKKAQLGIKEIIYFSLGLLVLLLGFLAYNYSTEILEAITGAGDSTVGGLDNVLNLVYLLAIPYFKK